jgi:hypothetical protein
LISAALSSVRLCDRHPYARLYIARRQISVFSPNKAKTTLPDSVPRGLTFIPLERLPPVGIAVHQKAVCLFAGEALIALRKPQKLGFRFGQGNVLRQTAQPLRQPPVLLCAFHI